MDTETVAVPEEAQEAVDEVATNEPEIETSEPVAEQEETKEKNVPLSALQKERKKRQEAEQELKIYREHQLKQMQAPPQQVEDDSQYEPVTRAELKQQQAQMIRDVEEKAWIRSNPEKAAVINEGLTEFLKMRPNLVPAIEAATNRYEEAFELMDKLSPKQKAAMRPQAPKKDTPNSPSGVPKAAAMNQAVDVMTMSDSEFAQWRKSMKGRK